MRIDELFLLERHQDIVAALEPFKDDPTIFISFVEDVGAKSHGETHRNASGAKIGINPRSPYETPLGIYAYPLQQMWKRVVHDTIPFAGNRPFVQVLQSDVLQDVNEYREPQYIRDLQKLEEMFRERLEKNGWVWDQAVADWEQSATFHEYPIGKLWNVTRNIAGTILGKRPVQWNAILRKLGYAGFVDRDGIGVIHTNEPIQAVFLSIKSFRHVVTLRNVRKTDFGGSVVVQSMKDIANSLLDKDVWSYYMAEEWPELLKTGVSAHFHIGADFDWINGGAAFLATCLERSYRHLPHAIPVLLKTELTDYSRGRIWQLWAPRTLQQMKPFLRYVVTPEVLARLRPNTYHGALRQALYVLVSVMARRSSSFEDAMKRIRASLGPKYDILRNAIGPDTFDADLAKMVKRQLEESATMPEPLTERITNRPFDLRKWLTLRAKQCRHLQNMLERLKPALQQIEQDGGGRYLAKLIDYAGVEGGWEVDQLPQFGARYERYLPLDSVARNMESTLQFGTDFLEYILDSFGYTDPLPETYRKGLAALDHAEQGFEAWGYEGPPDDPEDDYFAAQRALKVFRALKTIVARAEPLLAEVKQKMEAQTHFRRAVVNNDEKLAKPDHDEVETLYHTTAFATEILRDGFQAEKPDGRRGLGNYGTQDDISFTHHFKIAQDLYRAFKELWMIAHGQLTARHIIGWIKAEKIDQKHPNLEQSVDVSVEVPNEDPRFPPRRRFKQLHELKTPEEVAKLYRVYLAFSDIRVDPVFTFINETLAMMKDRKIDDIGILACDVRLEPDDTYMYGEHEFRVSPDRVLSVRRIL